MTAAELRNVFYTYSKGTPFESAAVTDVSAVFESGMITGIIGHTGSGKSTVAQLINGLLPVSSGEVFVCGKNIWEDPKKMRQVRFTAGLVFQYPEYQLFEETVYKDIAFGPGNMGLDQKEIDRRVREAAAFVGLTDAQLDASPFELSGGQMQRLMIARIFLLKPKILLADEPTSMVDACSRATILDMLLQLRDEIGMTIIFITHDIGLAYYISDTVYIMEHGKFVEYGKADEVILNPQTAYTKRLISDVPKIHEEWDLSTVDLNKA